MTVAKDKFDLTTKVAVITGAGGVICSAMAKELANRGVSVALLDLSLEKAEDVAQTIASSGHSAIAVQANVLDKASLDKAMDCVLSHFAKVDILINGAGGNKASATTSADLTFFDLGIDPIRDVFDLNVVGTILTTQVFGRLFADQKSGVIINIASMASYLPLTNTMAYSSAKAAVMNFTQWMAVHFNQNYSPNIRVNAIAPGFLLTEQNRYLMLKADNSLTARGSRVIDKTPMNRFGDPDEMTGAVVWLCSEASSFVNGAVIPIDGGFSSFWGI